MGISNHVKGRRSSSAGNIRAVFHQMAPNPAPSSGWLDKQGVQFRLSVLPAEDGREPGDPAVPLGHENASSFDLRYG
jgi:hypothetical protein